MASDDTAATMSTARMWELLLGADGDDSADGSALPGVTLAVPVTAAGGPGQGASGAGAMPHVVVTGASPHAHAVTAVGFDDCWRFKLAVNLLLAAVVAGGLNRRGLRLALQSRAMPFSVLETIAITLACSAVLDRPAAPYHSTAVTIAAAASPATAAALQHALGALQDCVDNEMAHPEPCDMSLVNFAATGVYDGPAMAAAPAPALLSALSSAWTVSSGAGAAVWARPPAHDDPSPQWRTTVMIAADLILRDMVATGVSSAAMHVVMASGALPGGVLWGIAGALYAAAGLGHPTSELEGGIVDHVLTAPLSTVEVMVNGYRGWNTIPQPAPVAGVDTLVSHVDRFFL